MGTKKNYPHGKLTSYRKHHTTGVVTQSECEWEISPRLGLRGQATSLGFRLTKGGVTGYESVTLIDAYGVCFSTLNGLLNHLSWSCCFGTKGVWDEQRIGRDELRRILVPLLEKASRTDRCGKCSSLEGVLAEDPFLLRVANRYEYGYWCANCHSARDKERSPSESAYQA